MTTPDDEEPERALLVSRSRVPDSLGAPAAAITGSTHTIDRSPTDRPVTARSAGGGPVAPLGAPALMIGAEPDASYESRQATVPAGSRLFLFSEDEDHRMEMTISPIGPGVVRVALSGRLDTAGVDRIETRFVASLVPAGVNAVIDLTGVDFAASMGIRMLVSAARSLRQRQAGLALYGVQPPVMQVFESVALRQIIAICGTEAEALAALPAPPA